MFKKIIFCLVAVFFMFTSVSFGVDKAVEFTWTKTPEADLASFTIFVGTSPMTQKSDAVWTFIIPYVDGETDYTHEETLTCADGTQCTYYFRIDAVDSSSNDSPWSAEEPSVTIDSQPPGTPTNFTATIKVVTP